MVITVHVCSTLLPRRSEQEKQVDKKTKSTSVVTAVTESDNDSNGEGKTVQQTHQPFTGKCLHGQSINRIKSYRLCNQIMYKVP